MATLEGTLTSGVKVVASDNQFQLSKIEYVWVSTSSYIEMNRLVCSFTGSIRAHITTSNQSSSTISNAIKFSQIRDGVEINAYYLDSYSITTPISHDFTDIKVGDELVISVKAKSSSDMIKVTRYGFKGDIVK